jgi:hypothetical protein
LDFLDYSYEIFLEGGINIFFKVASRIRDATFKMINDPSCLESLLTKSKESIIIELIRGTNLWIFWNCFEQTRKLSVQGRSFILLKGASRIRDATFEKKNILFSYSFTNNSKQFQKNHIISKHLCTLWRQILEFFWIFWAIVMKFSWKGGSIYSLKWHLGSEMPLSKWLTISPYQEIFTNHSKKNFKKTQNSKLLSSPFLYNDKFVKLVEFLVEFFVCWFVLEGHRFLFMNWHIRSEMPLRNFPFL